jgi:hypothetical protein
VPFQWNADCNANFYANCNHTSVAVAYTYSHGHDAPTESYTNGNSYGYSYGYGYCEAYTRTKASPDSSASADAVAAWRLGRIRFANALRTTRSTPGRECHGGSASPKTMEEVSAKAQAKTKQATIVG